MTSVEHCLDAHRFHQRRGFSRTSFRLFQMLSTMPVKAVRAATEADIAWIMSQEQRPDFAAFIHSWPREQHESYLVDADMLYLIAVDEEQERLAFIIINGLSSKTKNVKLVRMAVTRPSAGLGKPILMTVLDMVFNKLGANRLWLDVFDDNVRARRAYEAVGFRKEETPGKIAFKSDGQRGSMIIMSILAAKYREMIRPK
jgi:diamine N-acetyltransferase